VTGIVTKKYTHTTVTRTHIHSKKMGKIHLFLQCTH
jgi:hypothetical protein